MTTTKEAKRDARAAQAGIRSRALIVRLYLSTWEARKFDRKTTKEVNEFHKADHAAGRYNKHLFGGAKAAPSYARLMAAAGRARTDHYEQTLAWSDYAQLLPSKNYFKYTDLMRKRRAEFESALDEFVHEYPTLVEAARAPLNGMYDEDDYPPVATVRARFSMRIEFSAIPAKEDFRIVEDLPADQVAEIERDAAERVAKTTREAMGDAWNRLREVVEKVRERLSEPDAVFRDSLFENVVAMTDVLARLNVTNDPGLEQMRSDVARKIGTCHPQRVRDDDVLRQEVADEAQKILDQMTKMYGGAA